jgi:hypothetical protein
VLTVHGAGTRMVSTLVNAGVFRHPGTGEPVIAHVAMGTARRVGHLTAEPSATLMFPDGHRWIAVEGTATLIGPDHPHPAVAPEAVAPLLRDIYRAAGGGEHPDWNEYDRVMAEGRRLAVLVSVDRAYGNH